MDLGHCTPGGSAARRARSSERERKRIRILYKGEHQSAHFIATRVCSTGSASGASTDVHEIRSAGSKIDYRGAAPDRAKIVQHCWNRRVADRKSDWRKSSGDPWNRTGLLRI